MVVAEKDEEESKRGGRGGGGVSDFSYEASNLANQ